MPDQTLEEVIVGLQMEIVELKARLSAMELRWTLPPMAVPLMPGMPKAAEDFQGGQGVTITIPERDDSFTNPNEPGHPPVVEGPPQVSPHLYPLTPPPIQPTPPFPNPLMRPLRPR